MSLRSPCRFQNRCPKRVITYDFKEKYPNVCLGTLVPMCTKDIFTKKQLLVSVLENGKEAKTIIVVDT